MDHHVIKQATKCTMMQHPFQSRCFKNPDSYSFCMVWSWRLSKRKHTWPRVCSLLRLFQLGGKSHFQSQRKGLTHAGSWVCSGACVRTLEVKQTSYINVRDYSGFTEEEKSKPNVPLSPCKTLGNTYSHSWSSLSSPVPARSKSYSRKRGRHLVLQGLHVKCFIISSDEWHGWWKHQSLKSTKRLMVPRVPLLPPNHLLAITIRNSPE